MKQRNHKRVLSLLLSMLMIVGLMPDNIGLFTTTALAAPDEKSAYYLDAADLTAAEDKISTDMAVGTDNFFTISGTGAKSLIKALAEGSEVDTPLGTYSQAIQLGGQLQNAADKYGQLITKSIIFGG